MKTWDAVYQVWKTDDGQIHSQHMGLLIRCKDCKKRKQCKVATEYYYCDMTGAIVGVSEFCSWAERKEENETL